ncbi:multidrug resistance-associated protein 1-like isoform X2 [Mytilus edulis]|uniref:multidrug resistance-associated protein 1-like isoform X2 n=1 Tax=Mytilus edulis TaxID=6550 RepID=UPI0039F11126
MNEFCNNSSIWDLNLTWRGEWPEFTQCFQDTVLIWVPSGWLWLATPFYLRYLLATKSVRGKWSSITYLKMIFALIMLVLTTINVVYAAVDLKEESSYWKASLVGPVIEAATILLVIFYIALERHKGLVTSGVLFIYWTFAILTKIIPFYTKLLKKDKKEDTIFLKIYVYFGIWLWVIELILHSIAEKLHHNRDVCPEQKASFLSRITFNWITSLMIQGYKKPLNEDEMFKLNERDMCKVAYKRFLKNWDKERISASRLGQSGSTHRYNLQDDMSESTPLLAPKPVVKDPNTKEKKRSLFRALAKTFGLELLHAHVFKLIYDITIFISPILLRFLIAFSKGSTETDSSEFSQTWKGYMLAAAFFVTILIQSIACHQQFYWGMTLGIRVKAALMAAVYRKALTLTSGARKESTVGEIVNLMSIDTQHVQDNINYLWALWSSPLQIGLCLYFLYQTVGVSAFAGFGILILLLPVNGVVMGKIHGLQGEQMKQKDNRVKLLSEVLNGIKILKLYAWEMSFKDKIAAIRNIELTILKKSAMLSMIFWFSWGVAPYLVSLVTFATFVFLSKDHYLDAETAFVAISLFNILRFAINFAPMALTETIKASVSIKRLNKFLSHDELDADNVFHDYSKDDAILVENGTFMWDPDIGECLKNIDLSVPEKSLVAIVGQVGSGKSSLMSAILGDMTKVKGTVNVKGSVGYVPQQAWIQNCTLQDNILFGNDMEQGKYHQVIDACALQPDLDILPAGDSTEIGEKGINLSGGQKQRVSLARAVYHDTDIYLLDDPLSAVDSNVGKHIFDQVIGKDSLLKDKTRVLVTHGVRWLPFVDKIIVMMDGAVSECGSYDELLSHDGAFAQFLKMYLIQTEDEEEEDPDEKEIKAKILQRLTSITSEDDESDKAVLSETDDKKILKRLISKDVEHPKSPELQRLKSKEDEIKQDEKKSTVDNKLISDEKMEEGNVRLGVFGTYARALGVPYTCIILILFALNQATSVFGNIWLSQWTSDTTLTNRSLESNSTVYRERNDYYLGVYGGTGIAIGIFLLSYVTLFMLRSVAASRKLHHEMLHSIIRAPMFFFDTTPIGRIVNRFSADIETIDNELPWTVQMFWDTAFMVVATFVVISYGTPLFMTVIIPFAFFYFVAQRFYVATSRQLKRLQSKTRSPVYNHFGETVSGASVIRAYGAQERFIETSDQRIDMNQRFSYASITANRWLGVRLEFLGNLTVFSAAMFAVISVVRGDGIDGAIVGLSISYALQITENLNWLVRMTSDLETNIVSVERVKEYTEIPSEANLVTNYRPSPDWPQNGVVEFKRYSTRYRDGLDLVLKGINTQINAGEKVGIVGRTGAGKSSLTLALFRLIEPASGRIIVDEENLYIMGLHDCRSKLTILPQDPVLFSGSLRMNLDPMNEYKETDLWKALEHAHLKDFVQNLPQKLEYDCGEGGLNLSVGQRQLICLARSLLRKTKILVLDEATAAVDMETDDLIQQTIKQEFADCTVITIAHRLNTVMDYDRIMVLDKGEIMEFDSPNELLKNTDGLFYQLAKDAGIV